MSDLKHMHAKTECLPFNTEDVRLVITERYGKQEIRMHGEDARFIVEAIAAAKRSSQPEAVDGDPIGGLQAEARQAKLDDFIASMKTQPEATAPAQDLSAGEYCYYCSKGYSHSCPTHK